MAEIRAGFGSSWSFSRTSSGCRVSYEHKRSVFCRVSSWLCSVEVRALSIESFTWCKKKCQILNVKRRKASGNRVCNLSLQAYNPLNTWNGFSMGKSRPLGAFFYALRPKSLHQGGFKFTQKEPVCPHPSRPEPRLIECFSQSSQLYCLAGKKTPCNILYDDHSEIKTV